MDLASLDTFDGIGSPDRRRVPLKVKESVRDGRTDVCQGCWRRSRGQRRKLRRILNGMRAKILMRKVR